MNKLFYILFSLGVITWLSSCSEARKLQKAENRVLANIESVERVGRVWSDLHPCLPDSVVKVLPGRIDTNTIVIVDTLVTKDTVYITKTITNNKTIRDTIQISVKDNRENGLLKSDLEKLKAVAGVKDIQIAQLTSDVQIQQSKKDKWFWLLVAVSTAFAVYVFRKPILSLITKLPI